MAQITQMVFKNKRLVFVSAATVLFQIAGTLYIPLIMSDIVNEGVLKENLSFVYQAGAIMIAAAVFTAIMSIIGAYYASVIAATLDKDLRKKLFGKIQQFSMSEFEHFGTASLMTRCTSDINQIQEAVIMIIQMVLPVPLIVAGGFILTFLLDAALAFILIAAVISFFGITFIFIKKVSIIFMTIQKKLETVNRILRENIIGTRVIRAFNRSEYEVNRMNHTFQDYALSNIHANKLIAILIPIVMLIMNFSMVAVLWVGGIRLKENKLEIGVIIAVLQYAVIILTYLVMALITYVMINQSRVCANRIVEVLYYNKRKNDTDAELSIHNITELEFKNVSFQYTGAENPVLNDISFQCSKGERIGIIGGTGSGKSTIGLFIPRLIDAEQGSISINGTELNRYSASEIRKKIGYVPQKAFLFTGTIRDNIAYGNTDVLEEDIFRAAKIAQIHDFIVALENGYDTEVEQDGKNLSGGQKQRICIARALVGKKDIYLFDDCFSSLDNQTEALLIKEIERQLTTSIVIIITQKIYTIMHADKIIVLEEGKIKGIGSHEELSHLNDAYQQIIYSQLQEAVDYGL